MKAHNWQSIPTPRLKSKLYCVYCGLVHLDNPASKVAARQPCRGSTE